MREPYFSAMNERPSVSPSAIVKDGDAVHISARAYTRIGNLVISYSLLRNGELVPGAEVKNGDSLGNVSWNLSLTTTDSGQYTVLAKTQGILTNESQPTTISVTSTPPVGSPPAAPTSLTATAVSSSQINLTWSNVTNETGFRLERSLIASGAFSQIATLSANATSYSDTGRTAGIAYSYRVRAYNATGDSPYSPIASATTQSAPSATYTLNIRSQNPSSGVDFWSAVGTDAPIHGATPASRPFASGTAVWLTCYPTLPGDLIFQKWQLNGIDYSFSNNITVAMNSSHTVTAIYGSAPLPPKVLASLIIEGPSSVDERSTAQYKARATYTDSSSAYVDAVWDDDSSYASISSKGLLDADAVSSDRDIEIEATFTAGGVTKTRTKDVTIENTDAVPTYTLTRNVVGSGEIGHSPSGSSYAEGTVVSLHANEGDGYVFSHWTSDASGTEDDITITMNGNRSVTAYFVVDTNYGNLQVNIAPPQANAEGAGWRYDNFTEWQPSGYLMDDITPRVNRNVRFKDIPGWITPDNIKTSIAGGQTTDVNATYREILGAVQVTLSPDQANDAGARWRLDGGAWTENGVTLTDVSTGNHTVEFLAISGWTTPPNQTVSVARGVTTTTSANYGPPVGFPIITSVSPRTGPITGGTTVTIDGMNFQAGASMSFGGTAAESVTVVSPTRITAVTPSRASYGTVALALTFGGQTVTQANGFSYLNALGSNIDLVGQIGGNVQAVAVVGNTVYYGEGTGLVVSDFTNPSAPVERGRIALPSIVKDVVVVNNIAFVAAERAGLYAVDVSVPAAPSIVGFFDTEGWAIGVTVSSGIAYVADSSAGLQILSVENPGMIERLGLLDTAGNATRVAVGTIATKQYAFVAESNQALRVIDVTTPSSPVELTNVPAQSAVGFTDVKLVGTILYVSDSELVKIFDVSNPTNLLQIGTYSNVVGAFIDVTGNRLYTCDGNLQVGDLTVSPKPKTLGYFDLGSFCYSLVVANNLAFAAMGRDGLKVVSVSNPASMSLRCAIQTLGDAEDVRVSGNNAFVGNYSGMHSLDITNPARPIRLGTLPGDRVTNIVIANGKATLVNYGDEIVRIANVANPSSLSLLGTYTNVEAWSVALMGSTPVLAAGSRDAVPLPKLDVLNISTPSAPQSTGSLLLDNTEGHANGVAVVGSWAFIGRPNKALDVVNLADPSSPQKVGSVANSSYIIDVAASEDGNYVYLTGLGIQVVDVRVKSAPVLGQIINPPQAHSMFTRSIHVSGTRLFATQGGFVFVFDISDPASPQMLGNYDALSSGNGISVVGDLIFVADGRSGVSIFRLKDVDKPTVAITSPTANTTYSTNTALLTVGGTASDDKGVVRVSWENNRGGGGVANGTASWQIPNLQLAEGTNIITVTAEDANGNLATDILTITANLPDTTPPVVSITGPKSDDEFVVQTDFITLSGSVADNQSVMSVIWSNNRGGAGVVNLVEYSWSVANLPLALGPNLVQVSATDSSGNTSSDTSVVFFVPPDTSAPAVSIDFPTLNTVFETEINTLNLSGTATDNSSIAKVEWSNDRGGQGTASGVAPWSVNNIPLQSGQNVIEITAIDDAGNTTSDTLSVTYTLPLSFDTSALPSATVGVGYAQAVAISGGQSPYTWLVTSGLPAGMSINSTTGAITGTPNAIGSYTFTVTVTDSSSPQKTASMSLSMVVSDEEPTVVFYDSPITYNLGDGFKWNVMYSYLYTGFHPFAYVFAGDGRWLYLVGNSESAGYYYYDFSTQHWCYTSPDYYAGGYVYDFALSQWMVGL
ncbi:MAG: putative Ig domain-containing protein [Verrucomicrobiota bacterium]|nr:putative Ig domain-containing protein [Verrucomicrobiota bacterium]